MAAGWRHTSAVITGPNVSAVIQSAARLERGRTLNNGFGWTQLDQIWHAGGREAGQGRAGQGRCRERANHYNACQNHQLVDVGQ